MLSQQFRKHLTLILCALIFPTSVRSSPDDIPTEPVQPQDKDTAITPDNTQTDDEDATQTDANDAKTNFKIAKAVEYQCEAVQGIPGTKGCMLSAARKEQVRQYLSDICHISADDYYGELYSYGNVTLNCNPDSTLLTLDGFAECRTWDLPPPDCTMFTSELKGSENCKPSDVAAIKAEAGKCHLDEDIVVQRVTEYSESDPATMHSDEHFACKKGFDMRRVKTIEPMGLKCVDTLSGKMFQLSNVKVCREKSETINIAAGPDDDGKNTEGNNENMDKGKVGKDKNKKIEHIFQYVGPALLATMVMGACCLFFRWYSSQTD